LRKDISGSLPACIGKASVFLYLNRIRTFCYASANYMENEPKPQSTDTELKTVLHNSFEVGIFIKGFDGVFQVIGAALVLLVSPNKIASWIYAITSQELIEDKKDFVANHLVSFISHYTSHAQWFAAIYLASHGLIKIFLVYCLWKKKIWSYPLAISIFIIFGVYQMYRFSITHGIGMIILTVLDIIVVTLTWIEYKKLKASMGSQGL
jgi:uncharacterized membrane protein